MITLGTLPHEPILFSEVPFYHRTGLFGPVKSKDLIWCGAVKRGGNEPYCYTQEKQCAGHICRVLAPKEYSETAMVVRDDGTVWSIWFAAFEEICRLDIEEAGA